MSNAVAATTFATPSAVRLRPASVSAPVAAVLVIGAATFNLALCFVNTNGMRVGEIHVIGCEAVILSLVLAASYRSIQQHHLILIGCIALWPLLLASTRFVIGTDTTIDVKVVRDLLIPISFFLLGTATGNLRTADRIVAWLVAIVLVFAVFEYFWIDVFTRFFNIAKYYVARGTVEAKSAMQSSDLFISGMRPTGGAQGGRNLLPFLGDHRVSSLFLEPVSLGNFGVIAFIWGLVRTIVERRLHIGIMAAALALIVLADSRFGAYLCVLTVFVAMLPIAWSTLGALALPAIALIVLTIVPVLVTGSYDPQNRYIDNGFVGRFVLSARILGEFDPLTWFGLAASRLQAFDSGYAYIISKIGVIGLAGLWLLPMSIKNPGQQFCLYRNLIAIYLGTILCVSNSPFTIKTASLVWFLLGVVAVAELPLRQRMRVPAPPVLNFSQSPQVAAANRRAAGQ